MFFSLKDDSREKGWLCCTPRLRCLTPTYVIVITGLYPASHFMRFIVTTPMKMANHYHFQPRKVDEAWANEEKHSAIRPHLLFLGRLLLKPDTLKCCISWVALLCAALDCCDHWSLSSTCNSCLQTAICWTGEFPNYMPSASPQSGYTPSPFAGLLVQKAASPSKHHCYPWASLGSFFPQHSLWTHLSLPPIYLSICKMR